MNWIIRLLWFVFGDKAKRNLINGAKRKGVLAYLRVLQVGRQVFLIAIVSILFLQTMVLAGVGALITGILLWDADFQYKMEVLFWICLAGFLVPLGLLCVLMSQRLWFKISGAEKMLKEL